MLILGDKRAQKKVGGGFTLLEMVIAVGILGTALIVIIRGYTACAAGLEKTSERKTAFMLAENLLAQYEAEGEFPSGGSSGDFQGGFDGFGWEISTAPLSHEGDVFEGILRVDVVVKGPGGEKVNIVTFRENI